MGMNNKIWLISLLTMLAVVFFGMNVYSKPVIIDNIVEIDQIYQIDDEVDTKIDLGNQDLEGPTCKIRIRAWVDGRDRVYIRVNNVWYEHFENSAPGRNAGQNEPTYIIRMIQKEIY